MVRVTETEDPHPELRIQGNVFSQVKDYIIRQLYVDQ